jgi:hypothetical protein
VQRSEEIIIATSSGNFRNLKEPTVFMKELIKNHNAELYTSSFNSTHFNTSA